MKILQMLHFFLPRHSAGTEVYTHRLSRALSGEHDVSVMFSEKVLSRPNYSLFRRDLDGLRCHVVVNNLMYGSFRDTWDNHHVEARVAEVLDRERPDLVHVQHLMMLSLGVLGQLAERRIPVVMTLHDFWLFCPRMGQLLEHGTDLCPGPEPARCSRCLQSFPFAQSRLKQRVIQGMAWTRRRLGLPLDPVVDALRGRVRLTRRRADGRAADDASRERGDPLPEAVRDRIERVLEVAPLVSRFVSPSRTVLDGCAGYGLPVDRMLHLPNGTPPPRGADRNPALPRESGRLTVGFVGTPAPHKGVHVLLDALRLLGSRAGGLRALVYGSPGPAHAAYLRDLRRSSSDLPVEFCPGVPNDRIGEAFERMDALVVPSLWLENAPVVIQEARWFGVPVVASRLGGMAEAVRDGVDGVLFETGDSAALAGVLADLAEDLARLDELSAAAPQPMTMEEHLSVLDGLYSEVVREGRA